jgi:hypothetical protein
VAARPPNQYALFRDPDLPLRPPGAAGRRGTRKRRIMTDIYAGVFR